MALSPFVPISVLSAKQNSWTTKSKEEIASHSDSRKEEAT